MSTYSKFYFRPAKGEHIYTVVEPQQDDSATICGRVIDGKGRPRTGALVLLFRPAEGEAPALLGRFITDEDGHFIFGPLPGDTLYLIKIFQEAVKIRELEVRTD